MKITSFNPQVITKDPEATIALFEALGFVRTHNKTEANDISFSSIRMKRMKDGSDTESFHVDIVSSPATDKLPQDLTIIKINVDDFDAACDLLKSKGFTERPGFGTQGTASSKYMYMRSPSGMFIDVVQHIKNHD